MKLALRCALLLCCAGACGDEISSVAPSHDGKPSWHVLVDRAPGALLRVSGASDGSVFAVGADADGQGPLAFRLTQARTERLATGQHGSLWWWHQTSDDTLHMVGDQGLVLSYQISTGEFSRLENPVTRRIFGVWSASADDIWYVGGDLDSNTGTVLRGDGTKLWVPEGLPPTAAMFKVTGFGPDSVWVVGQRGSLLHCKSARFDQLTLPTPLSLLALSGVSEDALYAVGGAANGVILHKGNGDTWTNETPAGLPPMNSVWAVDEDLAYAAGFNGHLYVRHAGEWQEFDPPPPTFQDLHSVWVDADGGLWLAGGRLTVDPPTDGVLLYYGSKSWKAGRDD